MINFFTFNVSVFSKFPGADLTESLQSFLRSPIVSWLISLWLASQPRESQESLENSFLHFMTILWTLLITSHLVGNLLTNWFASWWIWRVSVRHKMLLDKDFEMSLNDSLDSLKDLVISLRDSKDLVIVLTESLLDLGWMTADLKFWSSVVGSFTWCWTNALML